MSAFAMDSTGAIPIELVPTDSFTTWFEAQTEAAQTWIRSVDFRAKPEQWCWLPDASGAPSRIAAGWDGRNNLRTLGALPFALPEGTYQVTSPLTELQTVSWGLGAYRFNRYRKADRAPARLVPPANLGHTQIANSGQAETRDSGQARIEAIVQAVALARDLINTPAAEMLPSHLADTARALARNFSATCTVTTGEGLLQLGARTIHAVGRASADAPRLIDIRWGNATHPRLTLVGKGVCFDSGGLDLKSASGMRQMKKDMGGAAIVLGLAQLIMTLNLPVRLRVLVPAVENAVSGNAYRPGDVIRTYSGTTVEIDNTDAEGRLVMCDALSMAVEEEPDLLLDFATLTGAARVAVGAEIGAMFSNDDAVAAALMDASVATDDPLWRLPLHSDYGYLLDSKIADTANSASGGYGGAITAALFLEKFTGRTPWAHFDVMAFNTRRRAGRPEGGEAMGLRAVFRFLESRYSAATAKAAG